MVSSGRSRLRVPARWPEARNFVAEGLAGYGQVLKVSGPVTGEHCVAGSAARNIRSYGVLYRPVGAFLYRQDALALGRGRGASPDAP